MNNYANRCLDTGKGMMQKKNVLLTKDGVKVGVKELREEDYTDRTQR